MKRIVRKFPGGPKKVRKNLVRATIEGKTRLVTPRRARNIPGNPNQLMSDLKRSGVLNGKAGQYVIYTNRYRLIKIVPKEELATAVNTDNIGGWVKIDIE
ncbi:MAG TPA: hypothetical protein VJG83_00305 [archaeon]|nr:hypothetical protein [archaeon]